VTCGRLEPLATVWTTPGFTDEQIHLFWAADLKAGAHARERDEFIEVVPRPLSDALSAIRSGEICDAKTMTAILYMAGFVLQR
jgi:ADP-ribose pyrophosphatase